MVGTRWYAEWVEGGPFSGTESGFMSCSSKDGGVEGVNFLFTHVMGMEVFEDGEGVRWV